jgi:hypothetical protein
MDPTPAISLSKSWSGNAARSLFLGNEIIITSLMIYEKQIAIRRARRGNAAKKNQLNIFTPMYDLHTSLCTIPYTDM